MTASWETYAAVLRAAAVWLQHSPQRRLTSRELAGLAFGNSKGWTPARQAAFSAILGLAFPDACAPGDRAVLVGATLRWSYQGHSADARAGSPWLAFPAGSVERLELDATEARGALVIENLHTFEAALRAGVGADLVVVWGSGYVGDAEITLLGRLGLPVGVFADLDPDGIAIVADVANRLGQPVSPPDAGEHLARLLMNDPAQDHLDRGALFWEQTLQHPSLSSDAFRGYGWWAEVEALDHERWEQMTLVTCQRADGSLDWCVKVAERCAREPITPVGLGILARLLRGRHEPWDRSQVAEAAHGALKASGGDPLLSEERERLRAALTDLGYFGAADI